jgi:hypothetical protein
VTRAEYAESALKAADAYGVHVDTSLQLPPVEVYLAALVSRNRKAFLESERDS